MALGTLVGIVKHGDTPVDEATVTASLGGIAMTIGGGCFVMVAGAGSGIVVQATKSPWKGQKTGINLPPGGTVDVGIIQIV